MKIIRIFSAVMAMVLALSCGKDGGSNDTYGKETLNTDALVYWQTEMEQLLALEDVAGSGYPETAFAALKTAKAALDAAVVAASDGTYKTQEEIDAAASAAEQAVQTFKDSWKYESYECELYVPGKEDISCYIEFGEAGAFDSYGTISVELWFKGDENMNYQQQGAIISNFDAPGGNQFYGWEINTWANSSAGEGPYKLRVSRGFEQGLIELQPSFSNWTQWHHIVYTHNSETNVSILYLDGEVLAESGQNDMPTITSAPKSPSSSVQMCGFKSLTSADNPKSVSGCMKKIRFWDYALSADEVKANMGKDVDGTESGLVAAWDFTATVEDPENILDKTGKHVAKVLGSKVEWQEVN